MATRMLASSSAEQAGRRAGADFCDKIRCTFRTPPGVSRESLSSSISSPQHSAKHEKTLDWAGSVDGPPFVVGLDRRPGVRCHEFGATEGSSVLLDGELPMSETASQDAACQYDAHRLALCRWGSSTARPLPNSRSWGGAVSRRTVPFCLVVGWPILVPEPLMSMKANRTPPPNRGLPSTGGRAEGLGGADWLFLFSLVSARTIVPVIVRSTLYTRRPRRLHLRCRTVQARVQVLK
mmetsp:Transcript_32339/g.84947  ORF Transcript_32339/g.84947 Transcript_32339/m.84947 type:complete len:236 (+) Transcript_32339:280-987(+)